ncbi:YggS family pyridoxal phosphate-dependent enzyme [Fodinicurvata sp. EGI_FJ10296]|uniref:YggS family pyridoxal phosphate-dependent enzyme n=1 Tax=Fodinicurvata sp. EGI_FJ10296 TaxID=3231908 RepID=UPI0034532472
MTAASTSPIEAEISANLAALNARIAAAAAESGRPAEAVTLVAVSKVQPDARIDAALAAGHRVFGENRVQEAMERWTGRRGAYPDLRLHLIGPLQTNKVRDAVALFDRIESVDRPKLARALARVIAEEGRDVDCLIQVNTGEEPQKAGVLPKDLDDLVRVCREECGLPLAGLMCIPPVEQQPAPHFAFLAELADRHGLPVRSMGMSGDFETAIHQGATHVRVGTGVFGERDYGDKV